MKLASIIESNGQFSVGISPTKNLILTQEADNRCWECLATIRRLQDNDGEIPNEFCVQRDVHLVKLGPPVVGMEKIICVGKNYADHARELGGEPPDLPVIFNKLPSALIGPGDEIVLPPLSEEVDYEAELVVVMGRDGRNIPREDAMNYVFGYCCGNDVTARDWQKGRPGGQWLLGKTFDTFCPIGPWIVCRDEIGDPHELDIELRLNGKIMQSSNTRNLIFPIDHLISHVSQFVTLRAGDLLFTGTPAGVGAGRTPPAFLKVGDRIEVEIANIGVLQNVVNE